MYRLRFLLFPFALIYKWITGFRNHLYNIGHKKSFRFEVPVIAVGNLNIGGSGKTPLVEYLLRLLSGDYHVATLGRGYGRKTSGIVLATDRDTPATIGDEPFIYYRKFGDRVQVAVGEQRTLAIPEMLYARPEVNCIVLDDAFQHRSVRPHLSLLVTRYDRPFYVDYLMPVGYLRESRENAKRADMVIVTKCPDNIGSEEKHRMVRRIREYAPQAPVHFTTISYGEPVPLGEATTHPIDRVVLLTGIANPNPFIVFAKQKYRVVRHFAFKDHHVFKEAELESVFDRIRMEGDDVVLLTTEKDSARLADHVAKAGRVACYYVPIEMRFCENGSEFDASVKGALENALHAADSN